MNFIFFSLRVHQFVSKKEIKKKLPTPKLSRDTIEILEYRKSGGEKRLFLNYDSKATTESLTLLQ